MNGYIKPLLLTSAYFLATQVGAQCRPGDHLAIIFPAVQKVTAPPTEAAIYGAHLRQRMLSLPVFSDQENLPLALAMAYTTEYMPANPILAGTGSGGGPHVRAFSGVDGSEILSFDITEAVSGFVDIATGRIDDDAIEDLLVSADVGGGPHVQVFSGSSLFAETPSVQQIYAADVFSGLGVREVSVTTADLTNNGQTEIILGAGPSSGGAGPRLIAITPNTPSPVAEFLAFEASFTGGVYVAAGDITGDSVPELFVSTRSTSAAGRIRVFDGTTVAGATIENPPQTLFTLRDFGEQTEFRVATGLDRFGDRNRTAFAVAIAHDEMIELRYYKGSTGELFDTAIMDFAASGGIPSLAIGNSRVLSCGSFENP